jgi:hypothetical protein
MKPLFYSLISLFIFASCKTSKDYLSRSDEDKTLFDVVKVLSRHPDDSDAIKALPVLYPLAEQRHLRIINSYNTTTEISHWEKVIDEYNILQKMYDVISNEGAANRLVTATNYQSTIYDTKQLAAEAYYQQANIFLDKPGRDDAKKAYTCFKKADKWVPGYKDAKAKMTDAYQDAIVNVVINPVQDNSFFFNTGWGNTGYDYSNEYFQQTLVRELGGKNASRYAAKFYTEWEATRDNIKPDWVVDLTLRNLDIPRPINNNYTRNASATVQDGVDSSGRIQYKTVYATVSITRQSFTARGEIELNITDVATRKNISNNVYRQNYSWQEEHASYSGDSRALGSNDLGIVGNNEVGEPKKEEVLSELYRKIYPQVKNSISYAVDW